MNPELQCAAPAYTPIQPSWTWPGHALTRTHKKSRQSQSSEEHVYLLQERKDMCTCMSR